MAAGAQRYQISSTNPNDSIGGGGCLCSDRKCVDAGGPYAVFYGTETDSNTSPHVVICAPCVEGVAKAMQGEAIQAGEPVPEATFVEVEPDGPERPESPVTEDLPAI